MWLDRVKRTYKDDLDITWKNFSLQQVNSKEGPEWKVWEQSDLTEQLEVGDYLVIYEKSGRTYDMTLAMIDGDTLHGTLGQTSGTAVQVDVNDIEQIKAKRIAVGKTTGAILGGIVLLPIMVLGVAMSGGSY